MTKKVNSIVVRRLLYERFHGNKMHSLSFWLIIALWITMLNKIFFLHSPLKFRRSTSKHQK